MFDVLEITQQREFDLNYNGGQHSCTILCNYFPARRSSKHFVYFHGRKSLAMAISCTVQSSLKNMK